MAPGIGVSALVHGPITKAEALDCETFISVRFFAGNVQIGFIHTTPQELYAGADHLRALAMDMEAAAVLQEQRAEVPA